MRRQDEARRGLAGQDRPIPERYQETMVRGEQGMPGLRREGEGERRPYAEVEVVEVVMIYDEEECEHGRLRSLFIYSPPSLFSFSFVLSNR